MFEGIQYLVSSKKLEDVFGVDNVTVVNGKGKLQDYVMTIWDLILSLSIIILHVLCDDNMGLDLRFIHNNIARVLHDILNNYYRLEINETNDFRLLIGVLSDPQAFQEYFYLVNISYSVTCLKLFNAWYHQRSWKMDLVWIM
ncbi:hypothetical protein AAG906_011201 [Vitis piasezkii]